MGLVKNDDEQEVEKKQPVPANIDIEMNENPSEKLLSKLARQEKAEQKRKKIMKKENKGINIQSFDTIDQSKI